MIPEKPGDVVHGHGEEHVLVDGDAGTVKGGKGEEDEKRKNQSTEGYG